MRLSQRSVSRTNRNRLRQSANPPEEVPDVAADAVNAVSVVVAAEEAGEASPRVRAEAPDTVQTHQRVVVTGITAMATELGSVWPHPHAHGPTRSHRSQHEGPTSLTEIEKKMYNMTSFSQVLARFKYKT